MLGSNSKSLGNYVVSSEEEKERLQWEGLFRKGGPIAVDANMRCLSSEG